MYFFLSTSLCTPRTPLRSKNSWVFVQLSGSGKMFVDSDHHVDRVKCSQTIISRLIIFSRYFVYIYKKTLKSISSQTKPSYSYTLSFVASGNAHITSVNSTLNKLISPESPPNINAHDIEPEERHQEGKVSGESHKDAPKFLIWRHFEMYQG